MARKTAKEISDQVAADALRGGSQSGPMPTHPAMATPTPDPVDYSTDDDDGDGDTDPNEGH